MGILLMEVESSMNQDENSWIFISIQLTNVVPFDCLAEPLLCFDDVW